jgi:polysaccharide export outer membrane protein
MPSHTTTNCFAVLLLALAACSANPSRHSSYWDGSPDWAASLRERVEEIPELPFVSSEEPSAQESGAALTMARGEPRNLTKPLRSATQPQSNTRAGASSRVPAASNPVVINVNTAADSAPPVVAPSISQSRLETLYNRSRANGRSLLRQFGYEQMTRSLPDTELGPVPDDYVIGPGDELSIAVSGSFSASHREQVDRDGRIRIPDIGAVAVGGRAFRELEGVLKAAYGQQRRGIELSVGLGRLRRIRVQVIGNVVHPGYVEIPALGTTLTALRAAGGATRDGSLRRIRLRRRGEQPSNVDAYAFLATGDVAELKTLHDDDVVFVPPVGPTYAVAGTVTRPGIYEILEPVTVEQSLALAGGTNAFAFAPRVQIEGTVDGRGRVISDVELDDAGRLRSVVDGEVISVGAVDARQLGVVSIEGEVVRPGRFEHRQGMRITDLLELADGLTVDAHARQVFVSRVVAQPQAVRIAHSGPRDQVRRRIVVVDVQRALAGEVGHDVLLAPLDLVSVRSRADAVATPTVSVLGAVRRPGTYELTAGLRISDLVALADNLTPEVYYAEAELIRWAYDQDGGKLQAQRFRFHLGRALEAPGSKIDPRLESGDRLVVRALRKESVEVSVGGEVRFPGTYVFGVNARITDLIAAAGGLLPDADLRLARFNRLSVAELQSSRIKHLAERTRRLHESALEKMVQTGNSAEGLAAKIALENSKEVMQRISQNEPKGRVVLPFLRTNFPKSEFNLKLEGGDSLIVPRHQSTVSVLGHVFNPGSFVAERGLVVADVVEWSGGLTEDGDRERLYVIHGTGRVQSLAQDANPLRLQTKLLPGDVVLVPRRPLERTLGARLADLILATRQLAEIGVLGNSIASGGAVDVTAVIQSEIGGALRGSDPSLLKSGR